MMTTTEIETWRKQLVSLARQYDKRTSDLLEEAAHGLGGESGGGLSDSPIHLGDLGNAQQEEEIDLTLMENEKRLFEECNAALGRIDAGAFGLCEECRRPIGKGRLEACPYARCCLACARLRESCEAR